MTSLTERVYLVAVIGLFLVLLISLTGLLYLTINNLAVPEALIAFGSGALGALAGLVTAPKAAGG